MSEMANRSDSVRAKHLRQAGPLLPPEMLRAHRAGKPASVLTAGRVGRQRAQHDMSTDSLSMGLLHAFANGIF